MGVCFYRFRITSITPASIKLMPIPICRESDSPNTITPTKSAVTGSIAPKTEVIVDPMALIALIKAKFAKMVGMTASKLKKANDFNDGIGCISENRLMPKNRNMPPHINT